MLSIRWRICAAHWLPTAQELDLASYGLETPGILKLWLALQQLSQQIIDAVPQPAHSSHSGSLSVERAIGASYGATGWACKAASQEADLARLRSARRSLHREIVGAVQVGCVPVCKKGLTLE